jgi:hypothetical protein
MLADAHKKELHKFDNERALPAWDSLMSQQQLKLQRLQVPAMHVTSDSSEREVKFRFARLSNLSSWPPATATRLAGIDQHY